MIDFLGRNIEYLRLSLTERCNLRCVYCRDGSEPDTPSEDITLAEIERIMACMRQLGIHKVRLTGGEPLLRPDLEDILRAVSAHGMQDICMTTNAQGLAGRAQALKDAGLMRLNISLDSLQPERYRNMTGGGSLQAVQQGIEDAVQAGMWPIKVNCVLIRGQNDDEISNFIALARERRVSVRFIELMPIGELGNDHSLRVESAEILRQHPYLYPVAGGDAGQPACDYTGEGFAGTVGFISPVSRKFCHNCNRVRVTSDAKLKPCLGSNVELDLRKLIREAPDTLLEAIRKGIYDKPEGHTFQDGYRSKRGMCKIGG